MSQFESDTVVRRRKHKRKAMRLSDDDNEEGKAKTKGPAERMADTMEQLLFANKTEPATQARMDIDADEENDAVEPPTKKAKVSEEPTGPGTNEVKETKEMKEVKEPPATETEQKPMNFMDDPRLSKYKAMSPTDRMEAWVAKLKGKSSIYYANRDPESFDLVKKTVKGKTYINLTSSTGSVSVQASPALIRFCKTHMLGHFVDVVERKSGFEAQNLSEAAIQFSITDTFDDMTNCPHVNDFFDWLDRMAGVIFVRYWEDEELSTKSREYAMKEAKTLLEVELQHKKDMLEVAADSRKPDIERQIKELSSPSVLKQKASEFFFQNMCKYPVRKSEVYGKQLTVSHKLFSKCDKSRGISKYGRMDKRIAAVECPQKITGDNGEDQTPQAYQYMPLAVRDILDNEIEPQNFPRAMADGCRVVATIAPSFYHLKTINGYAHPMTGITCKLLAVHLFWESTGAFSQSMDGQRALSAMPSMI